MNAFSITPKICVDILALCVLVYSISIMGSYIVSTSLKMFWFSFSCFFGVVNLFLYIPIWSALENFINFQNIPGVSWYNETLSRTLQRYDNKCSEYVDHLITFIIDMKEGKRNNYHDINGHSDVE